MEGRKRSVLTTVEGEGGHHGEHSTCPTAHGHRPGKYFFLQGRLKVEFRILTHILGEGTCYEVFLSKLVFGF